MKRRIPVFAMLLLIAGGIFYLSTQENASIKGLTMPGGASEENGDYRREWERKRTADPATGEVPPGIQFLERRFAANLPQAVVDRGGNGQ